MARRSACRARSWRASLAARAKWPAASSSNCRSTASCTPAARPSWCSARAEDTADMGSANQPGQLQPLIRTATPDDAPAIAHLLDVLGYACSDIEAGERIAALAEDLDQRLLVADLHGGVVGLICYDLMYYLPLGVR